LFASWTATMSAVSALMMTTADQMMTTVVTPAMSRGSPARGSPARGSPARGSPSAPLAALGACARVSPPGTTCSSGARGEGQTARPRQNGRAPFAAGLQCTWADPERHGSVKRVGQGSVMTTVGQGSVKTVGQGSVKTVVCAQLEPPAGVVARYPVASASGRFVQHRSVDRPSTWRQRKFKRRRRGGNASSNERTPTVGSYRQPICIQILYSFRTGGAPPPCRMTIAAGLPVRVCRVWQGRSDSLSVLIHKKYHISQ
jgi:hypothetical protein